MREERVMRIDDEVNETEDKVVEVDEVEGGRLFCGGDDGGGGGGCGEESGVDSRGTVDTVELLSGFGVDGVAVSFVSEIEVTDVVDVVGGGVRVVGDSIDIWLPIQVEQAVF